MDKKFTFTKHVDSTITTEGRRLDDAEITVLTWTVSAYGFLLERREEITAAEFAERIKQTYDITNPVNHYAYAFLHHLDVSTRSMLD
jgi:hypothetical protein